MCAYLSGVLKSRLITNAKPPLFFTMMSALTTACMDRYRFSSVSPTIRWAPGLLEYAELAVQRTSIAQQLF